MAEQGHGEKVDLMGMRLDCISEPAAIQHILDALDSGRGGWVITPNLHQLREYRRSPELVRHFVRADLVVADGMPLVWASRLKGTPLPARVAGSDLIWSLSAEASLRGRSIFLLGGAPGACERAEQRMRELYPGVRLAGCYSPPMGFERDPSEVASIRSRLIDARPDIVYVALGFPKQEELIEQLVDVLPSSWFLGVGFSLSFLAGTTARAPQWMSNMGLEWLHRLAQEPRRLVKRYLVDGLPFAARLGMHALRRRVSVRERAVPSPAADPAAPPPRVVFTHGALERARAEEIAELLGESLAGAVRSA